MKGNQKGQPPTFKLRLLNVLIFLDWRKKKTPFLCLQFLSPFTMDDSTDVDTGKIVYEWNPPTGIIDRYYYHDSVISQEDVSTTLKKNQMYVNMLNDFCFFGFL